MPRTRSQNTLHRTIGALAALLWLAACGSDTGASHTPASAGTQANVLDISETPAQTGAFDAPYIIEADNTEGNSSFGSGVFEMASASSDSDLAGMRGGFLLAGGLKLDFGLTTTTVVNGIVASNLSLSSSKLNGNLPQSLQQIIQVGTGNNFASPASTPVTTTVLTLVQNTANNTTIVNKNVLNLNVSNFSHFNESNASLNSILPLVRALR